MLHNLLENLAADLQLLVWIQIAELSAVQGMKTALHRSGLGGSDFNQSDSDLASHPDLVAYYTFENDTGYVIKDVSLHSHDLQAISKPNWQVQGPVSRASM